MADTLVETWRKIVVGEGKSWVLFGHGTGVIFTQPTPDLEQRAIELMKHYGPVVAGTDAGDFSVVELADYPGWVVTCYHPDILTYVSPDEMSGGAPAEVFIGLLGRSKRDQDARELEVIHVETR